MKLLFKALTKNGPDEFVWVKGLPVFDYNGNCKVTGLDTGKLFYNIVEETICQSIGKIDKNGREIFIKDRLKFVRKLGKQEIVEELTVYYSEETSQVVVGNENDDNFIKDGGKIKQVKKGRKNA